MYGEPVHLLLARLYSPQFMLPCNIRNLNTHTCSSTSNMYVHVHYMHVYPVSVLQSMVWHRDIYIYTCI